MKHVKFCISSIVIILSIMVSQIVSAGSYYAYSMKEAERRLISTDNSSEVIKLGGITRIAGMVHDRKSNDLIILGLAKHNEEKMTLDDFVIAMRAVLLYDEYPYVSIDAIKDTEKTGHLKVNFKGGIANTNFGKEMFEADVVLKELSLGELPSETWGLQSYFSMFVEHVKRYGGRMEDRVGSRFWFYPKGTSLAVLKGVGAIRESAIGVETRVDYAFTEGKPVDNLSEFHDELGDRFTEGVMKNFNELSAAYPEIARLKKLLDLTSLARGIQSLKPRPNLHYWLNIYKVARIETSEYSKIIKKEDTVMGKGDKITLKLSGGIELNPIVLRLQAGDVTALRDAVLDSRPNGNALTWSVPLEGWHIPGSPEEYSYDEQDLFGSNNANGFSLDRQVRGIDTQNYNPVSTFTKSLPDHTVQMTTNTFSGLIPKMQTHNVGGVMLQGAAKVTGGGSAKVDLTSGNFSLIVGGKNARLAPEAYRKFITALWTVYYSNQDPGISIDPIAPGVDKHLVRYIGKVVNTDLGRVMREADYVMKKWSVGTERPDIPGFKNPDEYAARARKLYLAASRFWFVPQDMRFKRSDDMLLFDNGRMTIQTEYLTDSAEKSADPANEKFADFFTRHYNEISEKYPVYKELFDYAKMVSLAKYLKEQGVPLFWFLMANKDLVITEDSPGTVNELVKGSDYFRDITISGGVNLDFDTEDQDHYVYDQVAVDAINKARSKLSSSAQSSSSISDNRKTTKMGPDPFSFDLGKESYTVVPQHSLTSGKDRRGIRYQTDMALRGRGLQLTEESLDILKAELVYRETMKEMGPVMKTMEKHNLDQDEIYALYQVKKKKAAKRIEGILGGLDNIKNKKYSDRDEFIAALEKSIGAEQTKKLKPLIAKVAYYSTSLELVRYFNPKQRSSGEFGNGWKLLVPYRIKPIGETKTEFGKYLVQEKMALINLLTGEEEALTFSSDRLSSAGYVPDKLENSQVVGLFMMTDGSHVLKDKLGNQFWFNPKGYLTDMVFSKDHRISYEYLDGFTDAFEQTPYSIEPPDDEKVGFLNVFIPKRMRLNDLVNGDSEILTFNDKGEMAGYVPENVEKSHIKIMVLMSDASFRLIDKNGNETALTSTGKFEKMALSDERPIVSAVTQGNHRIAFKYTIDNSGNVMIASAALSEGENDESPTFIVKYEYDGEGRLADIKKINSTMARKPETQNTTELASN